MNHAYEINYIVLHNIFLQNYNKLHMHSTEIMENVSTGLYIRPTADHSIKNNKTAYVSHKL